MTNRRVLLIDDDPNICALVAQALSAAGYDVRVEPTARTGIAAAHDESWDAAYQNIAGFGPEALKLLAAADVGGLSYAEAKRAVISAFEQHFVATKLRVARGNISEAARRSSMDRSNFKRLMRESGLLSEEGDSGAAEPSAG